MTKLDLNKKIKRESLLTTAFELFTTKGLNKTSISDIVDNAGVAKGTFYLYFKDKYDIRNKLVSHQSSLLFRDAYELMLHNPDIHSFEEKMIFIINNIIDKLTDNTMLLTFISKNLSWGIFKNALTTPSAEDEDINFYDVYVSMLNDAGYTFDQPEIMLFLIVELVGSTCYSAILYEDPKPIAELKPYIFKAVNSIIKNHIIEEK